MKFLFYDIENLPMIYAGWELYNTTIDYRNIIENASIICVSWRFSDEKKIHTTSIADNERKLFNNIYNDYHPVKEFHKILDSDDEFVLVAHNGNAFDRKKLEAAFLKHQLPAVRVRQMVDTRLEAKRCFRFDSNRLDYLSRFLGVGEKIQTGGYELWREIFQYKYPSYGTSKDKDLMLKALKDMHRYNQHDIVLLEGVFNKMRNRIKIPNRHLYHEEDAEMSCPDCGFQNIRRRGYNYYKTRKTLQYLCKNCGRNFSGRKGLITVETSI